MMIGDFKKDDKLGKKALTIEGVHLTKGENIILRDIDLELDRGDFLGIIGPNGGGKTTLLKIILGLLEPDRGRVRVFGKSPSSFRGKVSYVPQFKNFDSDFPINVWNVVLMGRVGSLGLNPFYSKEDKIRAKSSLKKVDMYDFKDRLFSSLSGGEKQRVLMARALVSEPEILLLDEPTASVDEKIKTSIFELLKELNEKKDITIILVSHDVGFLSSYVEKVGCLNQTLIYHGSGELTHEMIEESYGCKVDVIAHTHSKKAMEDV